MFPKNDQKYFLIIKKESREQIPSMKNRIKSWLNLNMTNIQVINNRIIIPPFFILIKRKVFICNHILIKHYLNLNVFRHPKIRK